jgi:hypothetical protein
MFKWFVENVCFDRRRPTADRRFFCFMTLTVLVQLILLQAWSITRSMVGRKPNGRRSAVGGQSSVVSPTTITPPARIKCQRSTLNFVKIKMRRTKVWSSACLLPGSCGCIIIGSVQCLLACRAVYSIGLRPARDLFPGLAGSHCRIGFIYPCNGIHHVV